MLFSVIGCVLFLLVLFGCLAVEVESDPIEENPPASVLQHRVGWRHIGLPIVGGLPIIFFTVLAVLSAM